MEQLFTASFRPFLQDKPFIIKTVHEPAEINQLMVVLYLWALRNKIIEALDLRQLPTHDRDRAKLLSDTVELGYNGHAI